MSSESSQCSGSNKFHVTWHELGNNFYEEKVSSNNKESVGRDHMAPQSSHYLITQPGGLV